MEASTQEHLHAEASLSSEKSKVATSSGSPKEVVAREKRPLSHPSEPRRELPTQKRHSGGDELSANAEGEPRTEALKIETSLERFRWLGPDGERVTITVLLACVPSMAIV